jgi:hypothetical protein
LIVYFSLFLLNRDIAWTWIKSSTPQLLQNVFLRLIVLFKNIDHHFQHVDIKLHVNQFLLLQGGVEAAAVILRTLQGAFSTTDKIHQLSSFLNSFRQYFTQQQIATALTQVQLNINMINYN